MKEIPPEVEQAKKRLDEVAAEFERLGYVRVRFTLIPEEALILLRKGFSEVTLSARTTFKDYGDTI